MLSRIDNDYWNAATHPAIAGHVQHGAYQDSVLPIVQAGQAVLADDGHDITSKLSVRAAPGHSPGHVVFGLAEQPACAVFCGDVMHHALQIHAPHWRHFADENPEEAAASRLCLLQP